MKLRKYARIGIALPHYVQRVVHPAVAFVGLFAGVIVSASIAAGDSAPLGQDYDKFRSEVLHEFESTPKHDVERLFGRTAQLAYQATRYESPWTVDSDVAVTPYSTDPNVGVAAPTTFNLAFKNRNGDVFKFDNQLYERDSVVYSHVVPYQGSITYGHDITTGGAHSVANLQADVQRSVAKSTYLNAETQYLNENQIIEQLTIQYFNSFCRIQDFKALTDDLSQLLAAAKVKVEAKTLSQKDFLVLKDTANTIYRLYQSYTLFRDDVRVAFASYGERVGGVVTRLRDSGAACPDPSAMALPDEPIAESDIGSLTQMLPNVQLLDEQKNAQRKNVEILKTSLRATVTPYIGLLERFDEPANYTRTDPVIGIHFTYNFEGLDKTTQLRAEKERLRALSVQASQAQFDTARDLAVKTRVIARNKGYLQTLRQSLETSRELLRVLHLQEQLGLIDPTAASQAYSNYANVLREARDLWENSFLADSQLKQYQAANKRLSGDVSKFR